MDKSVHIKNVGQMTLLRYLVNKMEWIKTSEKLPEKDHYVLVSDKKGAVAIAFISDENEYKRKNARTRKDKYPEKLQWRDSSWCCFGYIRELSEYPFWIELPTGPKE